MVGLPAAAGRGRRPFVGSPTNCPTSPPLRWLAEHRLRSCCTGFWSARAHKKDGNHPQVVPAGRRAAGPCAAPMFASRVPHPVAAIRRLSAAYRGPYTTDVDGQSIRITYDPGRVADRAVSVGNFHWRGLRCGFPVTWLLADALRPTASTSARSYRARAYTIDQRLSPCSARTGRAAAVGRSARELSTCDGAPLRFSEYFKQRRTPRGTRGFPPDRLDRAPSRTS